MDATILVIEDERSYRVLLELNLTRSGYRVVLAPDARTGLELLACERPDLVLLDLQLPDLDGEEALRRIRASSTVPVIMLTARAASNHRARGQRLGVDDYVTKPFHVGELLARVAAVLRRTGRVAGGHAAAYSHAGLTIYLDEPRVELHGAAVSCSATEYRLLRALAQSAGRVLDWRELMRHVWGPAHESDVSRLTATIRRLRRKLDDDPQTPRYLNSVPGVGYWLPAPAS